MTNIELSRSEVLLAIMMTTEFEPVTIVIQVSPSIIFLLTCA